MVDLMSSITCVELDHVLDIGIKYLTGLEYDIDENNKTVRIKNITDIEDYKRLCNFIKNIAKYNNKNIKLDVLDYLKNICNVEEKDNLIIISDIKSEDILYVIIGYKCYSADERVISLILDDDMKQKNKTVMKYFLNKDNYNKLISQIIV